MPSFPSRMPAPASAQELIGRAQALAGRSVGELAEALSARLPGPDESAKGFVGQLVEFALGADADAHDRPDFVALGIELKTVPLTATGRPKEGTFVCSIDLRRAERADWEESRLRRRLRRVLWLPVQAAQLAPLAERRFFAPVLWQPGGAELDLLQADWEDLIGAIATGRGANLSAYEGQCLQVRPKAANSRVRTIGPSADGAQAMLPLGFYLRAGFVADILRRGASESASPR